MPCHLAQANGSPRDSPRLRRPHWYDAVPRQRLRRCAARRAREEHRTSRTTPAQPVEQAKGAVLALGPRCARAACAPHRWNAVPRRLRRRRAAGRIGEEPRTTCTAPAQPSAAASCAQPAREARPGREDSLREVRARRRYRGACRQPNPRSTRERCPATPSVRYPSPAAASGASRHSRKNASRAPPAAQNPSVCRSRPW